MVEKTMFHLLYVQASIRNKPKLLIIEVSLKHCRQNKPNKDVKMK